MMIPYGRQDIRPADIDAVVEVLNSDYLTQGPAVPRFEQAMAERVGVSHAVAVNSATSALHIACLALGLGNGDLMWTSPITFVASANCGLYCGAEIDFVDIDPVSYNLDPVALEEKLRAAKVAGRLPKVVVVVHLCGQSADMKSIKALSDAYGFHLIEDASHAVGGKYDGGYVGNCRYSDVTVFSFHPVKIITTGEGGMALSNDNAVAERMRLFASHGVTRNTEQMTKEPDGPWYYQQVALGFNYRMTDLQAALGCSQLSRLDEYIVRRQYLADRYDHLLGDTPVVTPVRSVDASSSFHLYVIRVAPSHRQALFEHLRGKDIGVNVHYIPVHPQPYYEALGFKSGDFPEAERYYQEAISLPLYPGLSESDQDYVVATLKEFFSS